MGYGGQRFMQTDKFGNKTRVVGIKPDKKNDHFNRGFCEISNKLYKFEVSADVKKDGIAYWLRITQLQNRQQGQQNQGGGF